MTLATNHAIAGTPDVQPEEIQPLYNLRFERAPSSPGRGFCLVDVQLRNNGKVPANFPFLCLTVLGLNTLPAFGWAQEEITIIRKMQRFTPFASVTLDAGAMTQCCTIKLRYKSAFGGSLEFEPGSEHLLTNFPNLNLTCVVGAGNFPSRRTILQVPATAFRTLLKSTAEAEELHSGSPREDVQVSAPNQ
jgi:hypothetical protein